MPLSDPATVYQLRIRLDRISPMVWRQLLVRDTTTIAVRPGAAISRHVHSWRVFVPVHAWHRQHIPQTDRE